eukprot:gene5756-9577_t
MEEDEKQSILKLVKINGWNLEFVSKKFQNDFDVVLTAVNNEGRSLKFSSEKLKNNRKIVIEAIRNDPRSILYASLNLQSDREIALSVVSRNGLTLDFLNEFKGDEEVLLEAIKQNPIAFLYSRKKIQKKLPFLRKVCSISGGLVQYMNEKFRVDKELGMNVVKNNVEIAKKALGKEPNAIEHVPFEIENYEELVLETLKVDSSMIHYIKNEKLLNNKEFILKTIGIDTKIAEKRWFVFKNDIDIISKLISKNGDNISKIDFRKSDWNDDLLIIGLKNSGLAIQFIPLSLLTKRMAFTAVQQNSEAFKYCINFCDDKELTLLVVSSNGKMLKYAHESLKENKEIALAAVTQNKEAYKFINDSLKYDIDIYLKYQKMSPLLRPIKSQKIWRLKDLSFTF